ncbi:hypothetical protein P6F26_16930 [Roseibacterium sp. SDUM158017]|uniref:hypothetical protein n=1 Tax=Roseicyclus salinarum TaxID=3036773 RepID=UPI002415169A|nr:hypothetical protein [Roseibacterium sp. SDUM158017]MDG4650135.1 hypothetical protein [Roseibacterium sp. SDUM158017]
MPSDSEFDVSLRMMGNEVFGFGLRSSSSKQTWLVFGLFAMLAVSQLLTALWPYVQEVMS